MLMYNIYNADKPAIVCFAALRVQTQREWITRGARIDMHTHNTLTNNDDKRTETNWIFLCVEK